MAVTAPAERPLLELFETPVGYEAYLDGHYSTSLYPEDMGDWLATYKHFANSIIIYPLEKK